MEILFNAIIKAAGWSIIHSVWQGAVLYFALLLLFVCNPKLSSQNKHNLSFLTLCGTFVWFLLTFFNQLTISINTSKIAATMLLQSPAASSTGYSSAAIELPQSFLSKAEQGIPFMVALYAIGLIVQIVILCLGYYKVRQIRNKGISPLSQDLNTQFHSFISKLGIRRKVEFKLSAIVNVPLVIGYFKPVVLIPLSALAQLHPQQLEAIIIHELSHIRRNDYLLNFLKIFIETLLFFNPFVWLSGKQIDEERENACDDLVLKITGNPLSYAHTLLQLEKIKQKEYVFPMAIAGKKHQLLNRIKRITTMKTNNSNLKQQLFAILLVAATVLSVSWVSVKRHKSIHPKAELEAIKNSKADLMEKAHIYSNLTPAKNRIEIKADTTKKKYKIVITDEKGKVKEYKSIDELPADLRSDFLQQVYGFRIPDVDTSFMKKFRSPEWKAQMGMMAKQFDSPEWQQQMAAIGDMQKKIFESPEWKNNQEQIQKQFDNPEWKQKMQEIGTMQQKMFQSDEWQKSMKEMQEMFQSDEWRQKMKDLGEQQKKMFDSPEWKMRWENQQKIFDKMDKDRDEMKKEKDEEKGTKEDEKKKGPSNGTIIIRSPNMHNVSYTADTTLTKKIRSWNGNDPLFIVDGVEVNNALSLLNPEDISSMEVLRDAKATAKYGEKGVNGVVVITLRPGITLPKAPKQETIKKI